MSDYPAKTCELESLVTHAKLVAAALADRKTQQRRNGVYGYPGEKFELEGCAFVIKDLRRETMDDMTDAHLDRMLAAMRLRTDALRRHPEFVESPNVELSDRLDQLRRKIRLLKP